LDAIVERIKTIPHETWWKSLSYILSSFFLVPNITMAMFLIYMGEYNFFSYDFFSDGIFGMKWFFLTTSFLMTVGALAIFSPVLILVGKIKKAKIDVSLCVMSMLFSLISWYLIILSITEGKDLPRIGYALAICFIIIAHVSVLLFFRAKLQFISLGVIAIGIVFISFNWSAQSAQVMSLGLKAFGVGGDLGIKITSAQSGMVTSGRLKLITPKYIYFTPTEGTGVATYSLSDVRYYIVDEK